MVYVVSLVWSAAVPVAFLFHCFGSKWNKCDAFERKSVLHLNAELVPPSEGIKGI